ncbi:MAG: flagellar hook-basal body complex protein [Rhodospirillaceae bacterium]|nr:MAG: flagellar hook-basal body complex protein [Rhodospirillaceae bacterium]
MSGLTGIFNTSVQGMNTYAHALSVVSTNIDNVSTTSYKTETANFETLLNDVNPGPNNGHIGPKNFLAVKVIDTRNVDKQGQIGTTDRTMDLAINGRGFIVTNTASTGGSGTWQYTRDGSFKGQAVTLPDGSTGSLLTTTNGNFVYGWPANPDGTFTQTNNVQALVPVQVATNSTVPSQATTNISLQGNVAAGTTGREPVSLPYVDANGTSQTLTLGFTGVGNSTVWGVDGSTSSGATVSLSTPTVAFNSSGAMSSPTGGQVQVTINDAAGPQTINLDLAKLTSFGGSSGVTVQQVQQDGFISGVLQNTYFTSSGVLMGSYSNHETKALYQLPVASFPNDNGLNALQGNVYAQSQASGAPTLQAIGNSPTSTQFVVGALEQSTVDLSDQFAKMIVAQRAYTSSSKVLTTADEMTQAVRDLIR